MNYLTDKDLFTVWEYGINHSILETNLLLLSYVYPDCDLDQIASFSIGERDARLLSIRENKFGSVFYNVSSCSACGQKIEWETKLDMLKLQAIQEDKISSPIDLKYKTFQIQIRLPNSYDVLEVLTQENSQKQLDDLIRKCIVESTLPTRFIKKFPKDLRNHIVALMEEKDPQANIEMQLSCPECENEWSSTFDIMQYLWTEINDWAIQLMQDIYLLASNFGWGEKDILEMSSLRRKLYINMINQ